jgi:hypothetical protein
MRKTTCAKVAVALGAAVSLGAAAALAACASGRGSMAGGIVAEAKDLPDHFMVAVSGLSQREEPRAGQGCRNPIVDPRNGIELNLMRSKDGIGDYQVLGEQYSLGSRYGVDPRHYLRVDCATGKALGIVEP